MIIHLLFFYIIFLSYFLCPLVFHPYKFITISEQYTNTLTIKFDILFMLYLDHFMLMFQLLEEVEKKDIRFRLFSKYNL